MEQQNELPKLEWRTEKRQVKSLVAWEGNPRQMTERQVDALKKSLEKFNLVEIPAIDADGTLVSGHQRTKMLLLVGRGEEHIDVRVPNRKLTEGEFKELNVTMNKVHGGWDVELLASIDQVHLMESGFTESEIERTFGLGDETPAPPPEQPKRYIILEFSDEEKFSLARRHFDIETEAFTKKPALQKKAPWHPVKGDDRNWPV